MMPRVPVTGFVGPSNQQSSLTLDAERTINFLQQSAAPGTARAGDSLLGRPGLRPWATFPSSPIRGMFYQNGRAFVAGGTEFRELFSTATFGPALAIANDDRPFVMASNGSAGDQVFGVGANAGYIYDLGADTLTQITDPQFTATPRVAEFMDGYFFTYSGAGSRSWQWSALEDGLSWSGSDILERSTASDNINGFIRSGTNLWILGTQTGDVYYNTGDATTPFQKVQTYIEHGIYATYTLQRIDNTIMWLGLDVDGSCVVWKAEGYTPKRVSTTAVELSLSTCDTPTDALAWVCQIHGHLYYVLILPRLKTSWVYDVSRDRWYEWNHWDPIACEYVPFRPGCHIFAFDKHLVGDRLTGTIYEFRTDVYDDRLTAT